MKRQKKTFLKLPPIIGGKELLNKYVEENLVYPEEARLKRIEGTVELEAEIDDNGKVLSVEIKKGLAGGCSEEAIRLIKNVRFGSVKNKGIRLKTKKHFKIKFQLPPENVVNYQFVDKKQEKPDRGESNNYSYTITLQ